MMWGWVKFPKIAAMLAFFLPWMTVSCSGQRIVTATGINLITGNANITNPQIAALAANAPAQHHATNICLALALLLIVIGIGLSFLKRTRSIIIGVFTTSVVSALLIWIGTYEMSDDYIQAAIFRNGGSSSITSLPGPDFLGRSIAAGIHVEWHLSYWLTLLSLAIAGAMSWLVLTNNDTKILRAVQGSIRDIQPPH